MSGGSTPNEGRGDTISRNAIIAFATQMSTAAFTAALTIFLTRELGPAAFGTLSLALSVTGLVLRPAGGGTTQAAARFIAEHHGDTRRIVGVVGMALRIRILSAALIGAALFVLAGPIASLYGAPEIEGPLRGAALALIGQNLMTFVRNVLLAMRKASAGLRLVVSESAMEFGATVALVLAGGGATGAAFGRAAGYAFGVVVGLVILTRVLGRSPLLRTGPSPVARRQFATYAGAMLIITVAMSVFSQVDILLLGAFLSTSAVGIYTAPLRFIGFVGYPGLAIAQGVAPRLARHPEERQSIGPLVHALRYVIIFQAWVTAVFLIWATPIVDLLLGSAFEESAGVLRALTPAIFLNGVGPLLANSLNFAGEGRRRIPFAIGTVLIAVGLDVALIPEIGVYGAAVGSNVALTFFVGANLWLAHQHIGMPVRPVAITVVRAISAAAATAGILALIGTSELSPLEWIIGLVAGGTAFVAILLITAELTPQELRRLTRIAIRAVRKT